MNETIQLKFKSAAESNTDIVIMLPKHRRPSSDWEALAYLHQDVVAAIFSEELMRAAMEGHEGVIAKVSVEIEDKETEA